MKFNFFESFELKGKFWLPGKDKKIDGLLKYNPSDGIRLFFENDYFEGQFDFMKNYKLIFGQSNEGIKINVFKPLVVKEDYGNIFKVELYSNLCFFGEHFEIIDNLKIKKACVNYNLLFEWMNKRCLKIKNTTNKNNEFPVINYSRPDKTIINIEELDFEIEFNNIYKYSSNLKKLSFKEDLLINFIFKENSKYADVEDKIFHLKNLFTFFLQQDVTYNNIDFETEDKKKYSVIFHLRKSNLENIKDYQVSKILINYKKIKDNFENIVKEWFLINQNIKKYLFLYFIDFENLNPIMSDRFLNYIHFLEVYHRISFEGKYIKKSDYKKIRKSITEFVNGNVTDKFIKEKIINSLNWCNEYSLRKRIIELFEISKFDKIILKFYDQDEEKLKKIINSVVNTRNYYVHFDHKKESKAAKGINLYQLFVYLRFIIISILIDELKISKTNQKLIKNNIFRKIRPFIKEDIQCLKKS